MNSVLQQSYKDIEIIIVDDCSTDSTITLLEGYCKGDSRIRFLKNASNIGLVSNWNRCIALASGEWIKFVFQDDYLEVDCVQKFVEYIEKTNSEVPLLVSKRRFLLDTSFTKIEKEYYEMELPSLSRIKKSNFRISAKEISNASISYISLNFIGEPTTFIFKKSVTEELGFFNEALEQICDLEFGLRIASRYGVVEVPYELSSFRIHLHSTTNRNIANKYYKLSCLEPVKLAHQLLFDEAYNSLRKNLNFYYYFKLKVYFYIRGYEAYIKALKNEANMSEFQKAEETFPKIKILRRKSLIRRMLYTAILYRRGI